MKATAAVLIAISGYWILDSLAYFAAGRSVLELLADDAAFRLESLVNVAWNAALIGFVLQVFRKSETPGG